MSVAWGSRWRSFWASGKDLATAWMITAGVVALYVGVIRSNEITGGINNSKATGLARPRRAEPIALWRQMRILPQTAAWRDQESTADTLVGEPTNQIRMMSALSGSSQAPAAAPEDADADQKMVRTSSIDLVVRKPAETAEQIRNVAEGLGGFLVSSQVSGSQDATGGSLTIRVPAPRFEEARQKIRNFGVRVESERIEAQDVTRQYVDEDANLRNLRAEEQQYLSILRQARTVKDTLDVSGKLSGVRGQIEQQRAEFEVLTKQIETVSITVSLRSEAEARVFGLNWRSAVSDEAGIARRTRRLGELCVGHGVVRVLPADNNLMAGDHCGSQCGKLESVAMGGTAMVCAEGRRNAGPRIRNGGGQAFSERLLIFRIRLLATKHSRDSAHDASHRQFAFGVGEK
jgi:hypothetical protein